MMFVHEDDTLIIPEKYKKMSVSELEKEKEKLLIRINSEERVKKAVPNNKNNIVFKF